MKEFDELKLFHHRQIVINFYENDGLVDRNGMNFDTIAVTPGEIMLLKDNAPIFTLPLNEGAQFGPSGRIKNHYYLHYGDLSIRTELYFP